MTKVGRQRKAVAATADKRMTSAALAMISPTYVHYVFMCRFQSKASVPTCMMSPRNGKQHEGDYSQARRWNEGQDFVAGADEGGMSPLAGPVSAAEVILNPGTRMIGVDESKKLDANSREALAREIKEKEASWSVAFAEVEEIDAINIATGRAFSQCGGLLKA